MVLEYTCTMMILVVHELADKQHKTTHLEHLVENVCI